jgi:hypothetical protein
MSDSIARGVELLRRLVEHGGRLSTEDVQQIGNLVVSGEGRLPDATELPASVREKLYPRQTLPVPPITFPNTFPKRRS